MKIYNQSKSQIVENPDLSKGYLIDDKLFIKHHNKVEEKGHYEVIKEYPNGGKDVKWVVDVEGSDEYAEYENIQVFVEYSQKELCQIEISNLKMKLADTDYQAIKYAEGELPYAEYEPVRKQRREWRAEINRLEQQLNG